jgi:cytosine permease
MEASNMDADKAAAQTFSVEDSFHHDYATTNVPPEKRRGFYGTASVWVGWCISLSAFMTGGTIANGSTLKMGLLAVLAGNLLLMILGGLCGVVGFRSGRTTYSLLEAIFGTRSSTLVSVIRGISAMSFIGVLIDTFASTLVVLLPGFPKWIAILIFAVCITLTAINGFKGLELLSKIAAPCLWILLVLCLALTLQNNYEKLLTWQPVAPIPFITAMGAAVSTWIAGAGMAPDLTRYSKKASHVWGGAFIGYILGSGVFEAVAVICAAGAGTGNLVLVLNNLGLLAPAVIVLGLALWTTTDNNIYSSSLAFTNASKTAGLNISKPVWTIICVIIAVIVSFMGLAANFGAWLRFIGVLCGPLTGMLIAHFLVINRSEQCFVPKTIRLSGWLAWI